MTDITTTYRDRSPAGERYDSATLVLHWLTVLFVLALFATSLIWNYITPHDRFWRPLMESTHVSLGIAFAVLIVVRIVWRFTGMRRLAPETGPSAALSRLMYVLLYLLLAAETALGFGLRWLQGEAFTFFGWFSVPALFAPNRDLADVFEDLHNLTGWAIIILSLGHAAAALFHRYVLKDDVLAKMLWRRQRSATSSPPAPSD